MICVGGGDVMSALGDVQCTELGGVNCIEAYYQCTGEHPQCTDESTLGISSVHWGSPPVHRRYPPQIMIFSQCTYEILPMHWWYSLHKSWYPLNALHTPQCTDGIFLIHWWYIPNALNNLQRSDDISPMRWTLPMHFTHTYKVLPARSPGSPQAPHALAICFTLLPLTVIFWRRKWMKSVEFPFDTNCLSSLN